MFPYYKGPKESKDLNYDDIMAMYELYSKNFSKPFVCFEIKENVLFKLI